VYSGREGGLTATLIRALLLYSSERRFTSLQENPPNALRKRTEVVF
jgi:hypothetical protein